MHTVGLSPSPALVDHGHCDGQSSKAMITVRLMGGLGNQMFQYAFGRRLALETGTNVRFDLKNGFRNDPHRRQVKLNAFKADVTPADPGDIPWGMSWRSPWHRVAKTYWSMVQSSRRKVVYERRPFTYDVPMLVKAARDVYYYGYWQHEGYLRTIRGLLLKELSPRGAVRKMVSELASEMLASHSISVHFRDYYGADGGWRVRQQARNYYETCSPEYYRRAIESLGTGTDTVCYIFSDNVRKAKAMLKLPVTCRYVSDIGIFDDVEEILLMSKCRHHIIANSSFSWWGAWLGTHHEKTVVAPRKWMRSASLETINICPEEWLRV